jgi:allantoicase
MARLRLHGQLVPAARSELALRFLNLLPDDHARQVLAGEGRLAGAELDRLVAARPLASLDALPRPLAARLAG